MIENKSVAVVVPCYNEETQIGGVITTMPDFVDRIIVVDDASRDGTAESVREHIEQSDDPERIVLLTHEKNQGVGGAIITGYKHAVSEDIDVTAVMAGDGQMDPEDLRLIVGPVVSGDADYSKANRLFYEGAWDATPRHRYLGNAFLSMITKIASGYWHVADSQTGYTAISLRALRTIDLEQVYSSYGYPNDLLVRMNIFDMRVADVHVRPVYDVGENSKMKLWRVIPTMSWLIFRGFCRRMWRKYVIHDFHPLVLFYMMGLLLGLISLALFGRMIWVWVDLGKIPPINALFWGFCSVSAAQFVLFGMWFDMERNRDLRVIPPGGGPPG